MAFEFNDLKGFLFLVLMTIPLTTTTNINCDGKPFHCVNSTHFMICVDLGSGVSSTIDDFIIPCPPSTVCHPNNIFECEFPITEEPPPPLEVIGVSVTSDMSTPPPPVNNLFTQAPIEPTTALLKEKQTLTTSKNVASGKLNEVLENLKEEFTGGNETFFHVAKNVPNSTISPMDNIDEIATANYDTNEKTTNKISNSRSTESAPVYVIEANITDHTQTMPDVRTYNTTRIIITERQEATKVQTESSTASPSAEEVTLPKENKISESLNKEYTGENKHRKIILSPSNVVSSVSNLSDTNVTENNAVNEKRTTNSSNPQSTTESVSIYAIESNVSDNSKTLLDTETFDLKVEINHSTMKVPIESATALPMLNQNLTTLADLISPKLRDILENVREEFTGGSEPYFQMPASVPSSTITPSDNLNAITATKYDVNKEVTNIILNSSSTTELVPLYEIEANEADNSQTLPVARIFNTIPIRNTEILSTTNSEIKSSSAMPLAEEVPLLTTTVKKHTENLKEEFISNNEIFFQITSVSPDDTETLTNNLKETTTNVNIATHKKAINDVSNPQSILDSTAVYATESNISETLQTLPNTGAFNLMLDNIININQSATQVPIESSTTLPISQQKISTIKKIRPSIIDSVTRKVQFASTTAMPTTKQNLSTLSDVILPKLPDILKSLKEEITLTTLSSYTIDSPNYLNETTTKNDDTKVKETNYTSDFQSTPETADLYATEQNITDNSHTLHAVVQDSIPSYIMETYQSTIKIPVESSTTLPITEKEIPILKEVTSSSVREIGEGQKEEYRGGNETILHVVATSPTKVISSSNTLNGNRNAKNDMNMNKVTNKIFNFDSATESAPLQVTDVTIIDNIRAIDIPAAEALNTMSKNIMAINETTGHLKTDFQLQGNYNSLAITTTSRPKNITEQSYILLRLAHNMASNTVVKDNITSANIVLNKSNLNEIGIIETKSQVTTNHIEPDLKDIEHTKNQIAPSIETPGQLSDYTKISSKQPFVEEKPFIIKGLDANHISSTTYSPSTDIDQTVNIESEFTARTTFTPVIEDINPHNYKGTTLQNIDFNNDQISELVSTISLSYTDEIYETTPHPLLFNFSTTSSSRNKNSNDLNNLNEVTEKISTLVNYNANTISDPELKAVTPIAEVVLKKHKNENTSTSTHLLSPIEVTHSSLLPTTKPEIIRAFTPQYSTSINESNQDSQRNFTINDRVVKKLPTEQRRSKTLKPEQVQNSILTSTEPSYTEPIALSQTKVSEASKSPTNNFKDIERSSIDMSQNENMSFPKVMTTDPINTNKEINSTILTSKLSKSTDTIKDNNDDKLAADIPMILNNITDHNLKTSVPPLNEVFITKAKTSGVIFSGQNYDSQGFKYYGMAEHNETRALNILTTEQHNSKHDNILTTSIKPVMVTAISNTTKNSLEIKAVISKSYSNNTSVPRTELIKNINTPNTLGNEVLTTTEAYIYHAKDESIRKDSGINEENGSNTTRREISRNISTNFIADKTVPISLLENETHISNEGIHSTQIPLKITIDQRKNVLSRIKPVFVIATENPNINEGFNKFIITQAGSVKTPSTTKNIKYSNHSTKIITNSGNEQTLIVENRTNRSIINNIALSDIIFMNETRNVNSLRNMSYTNTMAQKEALQKDTHDMLLNSRKTISFNIREEINQGKGIDSWTENPMNIELGIDKKSDDISHENNYELSTAYFEVASYTDITTTNPLIKNETSSNTSKSTKGISTEINKSPDNLNQQQNITNDKILMSNVRVGELNNKEENQINYEQKNTTSNTNNINANNKANINNTASLYDCWNNTRGKYADRKDCRKFYICFGKLHPIVGTCPENTVFSEINKQCTRNLSHCVRNNQFHCLYEGRFSDLLEDNVYYICVKHKLHFLRYKLQCQDGYHLNKAMVKCEKSNKKSSQSASSSVSENSQTNEQNAVTEKTQSSEKLGTSEQIEKPKKSKKSENKQDLECKKEGKFPYPQDCTKYYVCSKNNKNEYRRKIKKCSDDKVYDKEKEKCVTVESSEC